MNDLSRRLAGRSPAYKAWLEQRLQRVATIAEDEMIPRRTSTESVPLSFAQQRLWFLDQLQFGMAVYNIPCGVRLHGPLNVPALEQSVRELVRRHKARNHIPVSTEGRTI